ncbi:FAD-binding oxidoreductase [Natrarchaeobius chitinivorans]|uniref:FAD-binding oxidoreductase n=2 Tax=Natrarchaeobius chitinivorans TaxID=1679083 RepID=A0A3N6MFF0_NATCH|nr:FAD-binding oxidoreductase [Natrarchaeobius chitinivorans]
MQPDITVLGAGVNGTSTALALTLLGYNTQIVADQFAYEEQHRDPRFSSAYGAGAILPYSVGMDSLDETFEESQTVFRLLEELSVLGVRKNDHYWIDEEGRGPSNAPKYLDGFRKVESPNALPRRTGSEHVTDFTAEMLFADMPTYMEGLYRLYQAAGGSIRKRTVTRTDLTEMPGLLINCTGLRSPELFEDSAPYHAARGHLVTAQRAPIPKLDGTMISYSYSVAGDRKGVYCFPRMDGIVMGGTHQSVPYRPDEKPCFPPLNEPTTKIGGTEVPKRIVELNAELLAQLGVDVERSDLEVSIGYRPLRDPEGDGVRVELAEESCGPVVHNYGHGGAGISVSWGCAISVARLVREAIGDREVPPAPVSRPAPLLPLYRTLTKHICE